jgi:hypothetical protein
MACQHGRYGNSFEVSGQYLESPHKMRSGSEAQEETFEVYLHHKSMYRGTSQFEATLHKTKKRLKAFIE